MGAAQAGVHQEGLRLEGTGIVTPHTGIAAPPSLCVGGWCSSAELPALRVGRHNPPCTCVTLSMTLQHDTPKEHPAQGCSACAPAHWWHSYQREPVCRSLRSL